MRNVTRKFVSVLMIFGIVLTACAQQPETRQPVPKPGPADTAAAATAPLSVPPSPITHSAAAPPAANRPVLIEFYSTICAICKSIKPALSRLEGEYQSRIDFKEYDVAGIDADLKREYRYIGYPQIVILDSRGQIAFSRLGFQTYDSLKADVDAVLRQY